MRPSAAAALLAIAAVAGCASVRASPSGDGARAEPKPENCDMVFFDEPPARAYEDLGELSTLVMSVGPEGPLEALRPAACALGADAVIVTRKFVTDDRGHVLVAGIAIKFTGPEQEPYQPVPSTITL